MKGKPILVLAVLLVVFLPVSPPLIHKYGVYEVHSQNTGVKTKSYANWFAKDISASSGQVTPQDLLDSPQKGDWLLYHGDYGANRFSSLAQINLTTVNKLVPKWTYQIGKGGTNLRSSPIVYRGVMYVTGPNEVHALDAVTGTWLWVWQAQDKNSETINRGVAIYGDNLFFATGDCRLVALDRLSGNVIWSIQYAKPGDGYFSTMAPLVVGGNIILGISNHNRASRGFVAGFSGLNGRELWRFWTIPRSSALKGAPTWMTGSYDPVSHVVYWAVGSLAEGSGNSSDPKVYDNSVVALDPKNGKVVWSTKLADDMPPEWDANEPLILTDTMVAGKNRKFILLAHRNGLFYLVDRNDGRIEFIKSFTEKMNWSRSNGDMCPPSWGATNWMSPSLSATTQLFYVMVLEGCTGEPNYFHLKAIAPLLGNVVWDYRVRGSNLAAPGILSTAGGIIISGEGSGHVVALNSKEGKRVWDFSTGKQIFSSPITYLAKNRQYISVVAGSEVITFGLFN